MALTQAGRHDPGHEPRRRRPPDARRAGQHLAASGSTRCHYGVRRDDQLIDYRRGRSAGAGAQAQADHRRRLGLSAPDRLRHASARSPTRSARYLHGRHGALRRPGRRRRAPDARSAHAHVVTTTTHKTLRGPRGGMILTERRGARQEDQLGGLPGPAGRAADARDRRQGGRLRRGAAARVQGLCRRRSSRTPRRSPRRLEGARLPTSSRAAPTPPVLVDLRPHGRHRQGCRGRRSSAPASPATRTASRSTRCAPVASHPAASAVRREFRRRALIAGRGFGERPRDASEDRRDMDRRRSRLRRWRLRRRHMRASQHGDAPPSKPDVGADRASARRLCRSASGPIYSGAKLIALPFLRP